MSMYETTDKILAYLTKLIINDYQNYGSSLLRFDELNVIKQSKVLYDRLYKDAEEYLFMIAVRIYREAWNRTGKRGLRKGIKEDWVLDYLEETDPVTHYIFSHEVDRKRAYLEEAVISSTDIAEKQQELDKAMKKWTGMINQYAIGITDRATLQAYKDAGVEKVMWVTMHDTHVCEECEDRDGVIFPIDAVPNKPHYACRCELMPVL